MREGKKSVSKFMRCGLRIYREDCCILRVIIGEA